MKVTGRNIKVRQEFELDISSSGYMLDMKTARYVFHVMAKGETPYGDPVELEFTMTKEEFKRISKFYDYVD